MSELSQKDIDTISEAVIKKIHGQGAEARMRQELEQHKQLRESIKGNENITEVERDMHIAVIDFDDLKSKVGVEDTETAKAVYDAIKEFNEEKDTKNISFAGNDKQILSISMPGNEAIDMEKVFSVSAQYWKDLHQVVEKILEK